MAFDLDDRPFWRKHFYGIVFTLFILAAAGITAFLIADYQGYFDVVTVETFTTEEFLQKYPPTEKSHLTNESIIDTLEHMMLLVPEDRVKRWEQNTRIVRHNLAYKKWIEEMDVVFSSDVSDNTIRKIMRDPFLKSTDYTK